MKDFFEEDYQEDFDDFIFQKLSKLNPCYEESAWEAMEAKLDNSERDNLVALPLRTSTYYQYTGIAVAVLLLLFISVYTLFKETPRKKGIEEFQVSTSETTHIKSENISAENSKTNVKKQESGVKPQVDLSHTYQETQKPVHPAQDHFSTQHVSRKENQATNSLPLYVAHSLPKKENKQIEKFPVKENNLKNQRTPILLSSSFYPDQQVELIQRMSSRDISISPVIQNTKEMYYLPAALRPRRRNNIRVGLVGAPEYNMISIAEKNQITANIGLHTEIELTPVIRLATGASYTSQNYKVKTFIGSEPEEFSFDSRGLITLKETTVVTSRLIDIPIEIKYFFKRGGQVNYFVEVGVSSYIFLSQRFDYEAIKVDAQNIPADYAGNPSEWLNSNHQAEVFVLSERQDTPQNHRVSLFGTSNIGIGMETNLSKKILLQLNPYYKIPLKGIGAENTQIASVGFRTLLLYNLNN